MTDTPTLANLEDYLILSQRVELLVASTTSQATANDKLTAMKSIQLESSHPEIRTNHGMKRIYSHGAPDIGIRFSLSVTQDIIAYLRTRGSQNTNGVIPSYKWAMKITSNDNTSKTITVNGKLTQKRYIKGDTSQGEPVDVECFIRVTDDAEPAAT